MPEVVRRRSHGPQATMRHRFDRWVYRLRPQLAVVIAFGVACLLGVVAASIGVQKLDSGGSQAQSEPLR